MYYHKHYISRFTTKLKDGSGKEGALPKVRLYVCSHFGKGQNKRTRHAREYYYFINPVTLDSISFRIRLIRKISNPNITTALLVIGFYRKIGNRFDKKSTLHVYFRV